MLASLLDILSEGLNLTYIILTNGFELLSHARSQCQEPMPQGRLARAWNRLWMPCTMKKERARNIRNLIFFRIPGHACFFFLYLHFFLDIKERIEEFLPTNPGLKVVSDLLYRYMNIWNLLIHIGYTFISLIFDLTEVFGKERIIPAWLRCYRYTLFAGLVWPVSWAVFTFWPMTFYRKDFVMTPELDLIITPNCNYVVHGVVQIFAIWELILLPKNYMNWKGAFYHTLGFAIAYDVTLFYTKYGDIGVWPYRVLDIIDGTIYFYLLLLGIHLLLLGVYFCQTTVKRFLWYHLSLARTPVKRS